MLTVYGRKSAFNVQKVMWLIGELGLPHEHIERGGAFGGLDDPDFRAQTPHGRVPVVEDDGFAVWESHSILHYLAARHGGPTLWSEDPAERSLAERWMDWAQTALQPVFLNGVFWGFYRTPEAQRDMASVTAKIEQTAQYLTLLDSVMEDRSYLLGDTLSLADIPAGTCLYRYFNIPITRPKLPNIERWYARLKERPAYQEHVMIPFDDLYGRLEF